MKIVRLESALISFGPFAEPISDALQSLPGAGGVRVTVTTEAGVSGVGEVRFGRGEGAAEAVAVLVEGVLGPLIVGRELEPVDIHRALLRETEYYGSLGLARFAMAAMDVALWDCLGKAQGVPCWQLWGKVRDRVPAYAMVGWLNYDADKLQRICAQAVEQGFRMVKIKVGLPTLAEDVERIHLTRRAVGDDTKISVDANQVLTVEDAIERGKAFQDLGCLWWEEPLPAADIDGYARLAEALEIPIATGENLYTPEDFARFLRRNAVDIVQPDLRRAGGPTALLEIGRLAQAFGRPYASHGGEPAQLSVMACLPNAIYLETGLLRADSPMKLVDGCVQIPQGPGFAWD